MAKERRKIIIAGPLWMGVQYASIRSGSAAVQRDAKIRISTPARESLNARLSWQKLMLLLACNFSPTDLVVTLTYREDALPRTKKEADKKLTAFISKLRSIRRTAGEKTVYVRCTEGYHSGGRLHHHLVLNATGDDYNSIRQLWSRYGDNVSFERFGQDGCERWAKYLTKEPREQGRIYVGDRTWRTSLRLKKPIVTYDFVPESNRLQPPPGANILDRAECQNAYGHFLTIIALSQTENGTA